METHKRSFFTLVFSSRLAQLQTSREYECLYMYIKKMCVFFFSLFPVGFNNSNSQPNKRDSPPSGSFHNSAL